MEVEDSASDRAERIMDIIEDCQLSIHDISSVELDATVNLPRFNMPFELGLDLVARRYGGGDLCEKKILIMYADPHRYLASISDIRGKDIRSHGGTVLGTIDAVRGFLNAHKLADKKNGVHAYSSSIIHGDYEAFLSAISGICAKVGLDPDKLEYSDFCWLVTKFLTTYRPNRPS
ncbi:MAG: hypothetical protein AAF618_03345 [Pseudomonadota bacterium]